MDRLEMLYRAVIMQHSQTPQNKGELADAVAEKQLIIRHVEIWLKSRLR